MRVFVVTIRKKGTHWPEAQHDRNQCGNEARYRRKPCPPYFNISPDDASPSLAIHGHRQPCHASPRPVARAAGILALRGWSATAAAPTDVLPPGITRYPGIPWPPAIFRACSRRNPRNLPQGHSDNPGGAKRFTCKSVSACLRGPFLPREDPGRKNTYPTGP